MVLRILVFANGAIALGFFVLGVYGSFMPDNIGDRQASVLSIVAGLWIASIVMGLLLQSRVMVLLLSIPVIGFAALFAFILLFAPLTWGDTNLTTIYSLQVVGLVLALIQIAGIFAVFSKTPSSDARAAEPVALTGRSSYRVRLLPLLITGLGATQILLADSFSIDLSNLAGAKVNYQDYSKLSHFPVPVLSWKRMGLVSSSEEISEIKEKIVYPLIKESPKPIAAIVIEFLPNLSTHLSVMVLWSDGDVRESVIPKSKDGKYDSESYKEFFKKPTP